MNIRLIGALFIVAACGGIGLSMAHSHRRIVCWMQDTVRVLDFMEEELSYHLTPLPMLCRKSAAKDTVLSSFLEDLALQLSHQTSQSAQSCVRAAVNANPQMPKPCAECMLLLGECLGSFDLHGQIQEISSVRNACKARLAALEKGQALRLRSYQTFGFCIGAVLVILLL